MTAGSVKADAARHAAPPDALLTWSLRLTRWALVGFVALDPISITLSQICVAIGLLSGAVAWTLERREGDKRRRSDGFPLWVPILCFTLLTVLSALFSDDVGRSLVDSKQVFQILILYWALKAAPDVSWTRRLLHLFVIVAAVMAVFGMVQFFLAEGTPLARRPHGALSHFQTFSGVLLLAALPSLSLAVGRGVSRRERIFGIVDAIPAWGRHRRAGDGGRGGPEPRRVACPASSGGSPRLARPRRQPAGPSQSRALRQGTHRRRSHGDSRTQALPGKPAEPHRCSNRPQAPCGRPSPHPE